MGSYVPMTSRGLEFRAVLEKGKANVSNWALLAEAG